MNGESIFSHYMRGAKERGELEKYKRTYIKNGLQYPERTIYKHKRTGELTAKLNGHWLPVRELGQKSGKLWYTF